MQKHINTPQITGFGIATQKQRDMREKIVKLEQHMLEMPQLEIKTTHHFADGIYAREIFIPKGTLLTGKIHRTEHLNIVSKGSITVLTEDGMKVVEAGAHLISRPGTKRVGYANEDCIWTTIHATEETDLVRLEAELIAPEFNLLAADTPDLLEDKKCHG